MKLPTKPTCSACGQQYDRNDYLGHVKTQQHAASLAKPQPKTKRK